MDTVPSQPQSIAIRDSVSVHCQIAFDFVIDGTGRNISIAVIPLDCGYQIDHFAIHFVPFCRVSPASEDHVQERSYLTVHGLGGGGHSEYLTLSPELKLKSGGMKLALRGLRWESENRGKFLPLIRGDFPGLETGKSD